MKDKSFKRILLYITYTIVLAFIFINFKTVWSIISNVFRVITPFIYGFLIAYLLNFPYKLFNNKVFKNMGTKRKKLKKLKKPLSLLLTYILGFGIISFLLIILLPEIGKSIESLFLNFSGYAEKFKVVETNAIEWLNNKFNLNITDKTIFDSLLNNILSIKSDKELSQSIGKILSNIFPFAINTAKIFTINVYNWIIATIISIYFLLGKEKLLGQINKFFYAYLPKKTYKKAVEITDLSNNICGKFIVGKIIDSTIVGVICFIFLHLFNFEYALLISFVVGITNIIPFFGPFIGAIPSAFLLLIVDPIQCLWFIIFIIVLQQVDGNIIGPKILGTSIGVSGLWIMVGVIVGGGLFGVAGMILGVPVMAIIYTLVRENVNKRINKKKTTEIKKI